MSNNNNNNNNPNAKIQALAERQMQSMSSSIAQYKNYQMQNAMKGPHRQHAQHQNQYQQHNEYQAYHDMEDDGQSDLDNTNLYIKGLWKDCTQVELDDLFKQFGVISQSRVYGDGVGFVRFEQGHEAKAAIEAMDKAKMDRCPDQLLVKYAFRKQRPNKRYIRVGDQVKQYDVEMIMNKNTNNVYLRCLPRGFTEPQLKGLCEPFGELTCTRLRESGVAFVRYRKSEDAQTAIRALNGRRFENHDETLLAKLANSDPFQPKIGFKQKQGFGDEEEIESVADSANTMTPSQGNMPGAGAPDMMHHGNQHQHQQPPPQESQQQQQRNQQSASHHQAQHIHHTAPPQQLQQQQQPPPPQQQQQPGGYNQYASAAQPYHSGYDQHHAAQHYNNQYDPPPVSYNHYLSPNHIAPYDQGTHYNNHYRGIPPGAPPGPMPAAYPHNYADPSYALQADPNAAVAPPPQHAVAAYPGAPYYATYPYAAYYTHPTQPAYVVPAPQAMAATAVNNVTTAPGTVTVTTPSATSPNTVAAGSSVQAATTSGATPTTAITTNTATTSTNNNVSAINASNSSAVNAATPSNNVNAVNASQQAQQQNAAQNTVTSPTAESKTAAASQQQSGKPGGGVALYTVPQVANGGIVYNPAANAFIPNALSVTSPPGSELSFRQHGANPMTGIGAGSDISSIASHVVSDIIANVHGGPAINVSKVAGHDNIGHISPALPQNKAQQQQQWPYISGNATVNAATTGSATSSQTGGIEQALKKLNIVPDNKPVDENKNNGNVNSGASNFEAAAASSTASASDMNAATSAIGQMQKMEAKTSNPHHVSKDLANRLHSVIHEWYPKKAGKLTGMFLQNHDQEKVIRYLGRPERLKKRIDTFVSLLENQMATMNKKPETD
eukprot:CAMPEP_0197073536 /NCGR_PEP_ID=MMETSP1384-20130603/210655_1 /TAXON_ID=29189 /ORGANISM="Ammonia sp." /LENGTH=891 /DNA_ID=CAMNT_0042512373 /DNA_START=2767 /DNA_END=5442 /DNA_ORIENTATION=-